MLYLGDSKRCSKCGEYKLFSEYYKDYSGRRKYNLKSECKKCAESLRRLRHPPHKRSSLVYLGDSKRCSKCRKYKPLTAYYKNKSARRGIMSACKTCAQRKRKFRDVNDQFWKQFWPRTTRMGDCLIWGGACTSRGQPVCSYNGRRNTSVRRIVYRLALGELPADMVVLTTCNNALCVSQRHLKIGTRNDLKVKLANMSPTGERNGAHTKPDRVPRGDRSGRRLHPERYTVLRGEQCKHAKLTEDAVREIRRLYAQGGISMSTLADRFGVTYAPIWRVINNKGWKHVDA